MNIHQMRGEKNQVITGKREKGEPCRHVMMPGNAWAEIRKRPAGIPLCPKSKDDKKEAPCGYTFMSEKAGTIKRKGENKMRKYKNGGQLETVICNCCGKKIIVSKGVAREGVMHISHAWDFFSEKDGEVHHFDLCETCYDAMISEFRIPVEREEQLEYL